MKPDIGLQCDVLFPLLKIFTTQFFTAQNGVSSVIFHLFVSAQLRIIEDVKDNGDSDEKLGHSCKSGLPGCKIVEPEEQNEINFKENCEYLLLYNTKDPDPFGLI